MSKGKLVGCVRLWAMSVILLGVTNAVLGLVGLSNPASPSAAFARCTDAPSS